MMNGQSTECDHRFTNMPLLTRDFCVRCGRAKPVHDAEIERLRSERDEALQALGESRARYGDMEARLVAAEAVIEKVRAVVTDPAGFFYRDVVNVIDTIPSTVLADHDKEVAARAVEEFAVELQERYPEDVFRPLSDSDHRSVNDALSGRALRTHITRDAVSADMMRRAAAQAVDYASELRSGSEGDTR